MNKKDIVNYINKFNDLPLNWDGEGAIPPLKECYDNSIMVVNSLDEKYFNTDLDVCRIHPNPNGTISFYWYVDYDHNIHLEIGKNNMSYYVELKLALSDVKYFDNIEFSKNAFYDLNFYLKLLFIKDGK